MERHPQWERLLLGILVIVLIGILGIQFFEGYSFLEALWFIIVSLTTTGYGDYVPVTTAGRIFVMALLFIGVGLILYAFGNGVAVIVEGKLADALGRKGMRKRIAELEGHILICGAGRVGRQVIQSLKKEKIPFVVIENDVNITRELREQGVLVLEGDATADEILLEAGIRKARGLIAALPSDADNVFVSLTGKELNPNIIIVARANRDESESKLIRAGADKVIAPEAIGGRRMAVSILKPVTVEFVETIMNSRGTEIEIEEIMVSDCSSLIGKTLRDSRIKDQTGAMIIAIMREGEIIGVPQADEKIKPHDLLIAIGTRNQLSLLENLAVISESKEV